MVEPGAAEARLQVVVETGVVTEHHPFEDRAPFSRETGCRGAAEPGPQSVGDTAEPAAAADDVPLVDVQDHVHALPPQPRPLVEAVVRPARQLDDREQAQDRALRRRAAGRELELHALVQRTPVEANDAGRDTLAEPPDSRLARDDDAQPPRRADGRQQRAAVERGQAQSSPRPAEQPDRGEDDRESPSR